MGSTPDRHPPNQVAAETLSDAHAPHRPMECPYAPVCDRPGSKRCDRGAEVQGGSCACLLQRFAECGSSRIQQVICLDQRARFAPLFFAQRRIAQQRHNLMGHRLGPVLRARVLAIKHVAHAGPILGHHRQSRPLRFEIHEAERLVHTRPKEQARPGVDRCQIIRAQSAQKRDPITMRGHHPFHLCPRLAIARNAQRPFQAGRQQCKRICNQLIRRQLIPMPHHPNA
mmetsp:Transcript_23004/g.38912  ORF Transcript_23004/g.38912 Transcript_23004/m.38912 type:complete len:227 (-) Transcript_23004:177-857(-)